MADNATKTQRIDIQIVGVAQELFSTEELQQKFSLERITKSAAVFDKTKLSWMNGQYLRELPDDEVGHSSDTCKTCLVLLSYTLTQLGGLC